MKPKTPLLSALRERSAIVEKLGIKTYLDEDNLPVIECHKTDQIKNHWELMEACGYDKDEWEAIRPEATIWNQMSTANGLVPLYRVHAKLTKRDLSHKNVTEIIARGWAAFKRGLSIVPAKGAKPCATGAGRMVLLSIPDLHLGKLAWNPETGHGNYNTEIACRVHREAVDDLIGRAPKAEECWFVVGNDFFNVDNKNRTTTGGTPQDEDGRWQKTYVKGKEVLMEAIGVLRRKYPKVHVIVMPGNHDGERMYYLGDCLFEAFKNVDGITVDNGEGKRKYKQWGDTGFGFAHGDCLKEKNVPDLSMGEAREIWGKTKRFEFLIGHLHNSNGKIIHTHGWLGAVKFRILPSLTPPDAWHAANGYVLAEQAAELYVYNKQGLEMTLNHYPNLKNFA